MDSRKKERKKLLRGSRDSRKKECDGRRKNKIKREEEELDVYYDPWQEEEELDVYYDPWQEEEELDVYYDTWQHWKLLRDTRAIARWEMQTD